MVKTVTLKCDVKIKLTIYTYAQIPSFSLVYNVFIAVVKVQTNYTDWEAKQHITSSIKLSLTAEKVGTDVETILLTW